MVPLSLLVTAVFYGFLFLPGVTVRGFVHVTPFPTISNGYVHADYMSRLHASSSSPLSSAEKEGESSVRRHFPTNYNRRRRAFLTKLVATVTTSTAALFYKRVDLPPKQTSVGLKSSLFSDPISTDFKLSSTDAGTTTAEVTQNRLASIEQAVMILEESCDCRFLHAVAGLDYQHLMYRGISLKNGETAAATIQSEPSDLLLESTYGSKEAVEYFEYLEREVMAGQPIRPSTGHLATTSIEVAKQWGQDAASIWPLNDSGRSAEWKSDNEVHFAWLEDGGEFWPTRSSQTSIDGGVPNSSQTVIVDGVDCGRLSLEDALERENSEIMFRANRYLAIPLSMEEELISKLRNLFLI